MTSKEIAAHCRERAKALRAEAKILGREADALDGAADKLGKRPGRPRKERNDGSEG